MTDIKHLYLAVPDACELFSYRSQHIPLFAQDSQSQILDPCIEKDLTNIVQG